MWHVTQSMCLTSLPQKFKAPNQKSSVRFFVLLSTESGGGEIRAVNPIILLPDTLTCLPSNNFLLSGQFFEWESKQRTNKYVQEKLPRTPIAVGQTYYYHQDWESHVPCLTEINWLNDCTMQLSIEIGESKIFKSKGPVFTQFCSKF